LLAEALAASGLTDEPMESELSHPLSRLPPLVYSDLAYPVLTLRYYLVGKARECEQSCGRGGLQASSLRVQALLALGRAKEVAANESFEKACEDPWVALAVGLGLALEGQPEEAARWRERACAKLESLGSRMRRPAEILRAAEPAPVDDATRVF